MRERIDNACQRAGRNPDEINLLLATKTVSPEKINEAIDAGATLIGENRVQELQQKYNEVNNDDAEWHFIGHLQRNKVRHVINYVTCIHSVDRLRLANTLHNRLTRDGKRMDVLIQVNTSYEESKFGISPEKALELIEQVAQLDTLQIKGLMTIGKFSPNPDDTRQCFRLLKSIQEQVIQRNIPGVKMDVLSMGMSGDLEVAIEEGATMIRVGTAIFGERMYPDSYYWNEHSR